MKTKEWVLLIIILMLGQLIIHYISMDFSKSGRALGYVSIAGTVVSIMLGFIAIIYSFVQSVTHSNSVAEIKGQVEKLIEAGHGISSLEGELQRSAKKIRSATKELTLHINKNTSVSEKVYTEVESLKRAYAKEAPYNGASVQTSNYLPELQTQWVLLEVVYLMIYHAAAKEMTLADFHAKVLEPYSAKTEWEDRFIAGALTSVSMLLEEGKVISIERDPDIGVTFKKSDNFDNHLGAISLEVSGYESDEALAYIKLFGDEIKS